MKDTFYQFILIISYFFGCEYMDSSKLDKIFSGDVLREMFPADRSDSFFEALFGDADDGAYDIALTYQGYNDRAKSLRFQLDLHERPGRCLACNMTYGLPEVFSRHPIINIKGLVAEVEAKLDGDARCESWKLGHTMPNSRSMHSIPLEITLSTDR
jgi:hypothetical protein